MAIEREDILANVHAINNNSNLNFNVHFVGRKGVLELWIYNEGRTFPAGSDAYTFTELQNILYGIHLGLGIGFQHSVRYR